MITITLVCHLNNDLINTKLCSQLFFYYPVLKKIKLPYDLVFSSDIYSDFIRVHHKEMIELDLINHLIIKYSKLYKNISYSINKRI